MNDKILNKEEATQFFRYSSLELNWLMKKKALPFSKINGDVLFQKKDLIKWLESYKVI